MQVFHLQSKWQILVHTLVFIHLSSIGLSKQLTNKDYYKKDTKEIKNVPIRWVCFLFKIITDLLKTAPEFLFDGHFSVQSDVYSFGVVLYGTPSLNYSISFPFRNL